MNINNTNKWTYASKYLSGELNGDEYNEFVNWIESDKQNKEFFEEVKNDWETMELQNNKLVNVDNAWDKLKNRLEDDNLIENKPVKVINLYNIVRIAAIFIIVAGLGIMAFNTMNHSGQQVASNDNGKNINITLDDGTIVTLNSNTKLYYPKTFAGKTREVTLEGEAFFDVAQNPDKPFIINANNAFIRVLGTSFNVNARKGAAKTEVLVETGKVQVTQKELRKSTILTPGEMGIIHKSGLNKTKHRDINYLSWKTRKIVIDNKLSDIVPIIKRAYNIDVELADKTIGEFPLHSTFENQSVEVIMDLICTPFNLKWKKDGKKYIIYN